MPIYSNLYSNLARQGIAKTFTHGYAQSVVAATHPVYQTSHQSRSFNRRQNRFGRLPSYQFHNAFHSSAGTSNAVVEGRVEKAVNDGGLDAYFDAWKKHQIAGEPEKEWVQFQFAKRIEWRPLNAVEEVEGKDAETQDVKVQQQALEVPKPLERAYSTSAVDDLRRGGGGDAGDAALAQINAAIAEEIKSQAQKSIAAENAELAAQEAELLSPPRTPVTPPRAIPSDKTYEPKTPVRAESQSQTYAEHLQKLSQTQRYGDIPPVFQSMLVAGIKPTADSYNALIDAAVHLTAEKTQVVPKALDIYADMLRRKVEPNPRSYARLIDLISSRSQEIAHEKDALEVKRLRYGGVEEDGKFMLASNELDYAILEEEDQLDLALKFYNEAILARKDVFPAETYSNMISACARTNRVKEMYRVYDHMEVSKVTPVSGMFPHMIQASAASGDLVNAVECYNEYRSLAIADDQGTHSLSDRQDFAVYAAVVRAYIMSDKVQGAVRFYEKMLHEYGPNASLQNIVISQGFIKSLLEKRYFFEALAWAENLESSARANAMSDIVASAADRGAAAVASAAFSNIPRDFAQIATPTTAMLALSVRSGDVISAQAYWQILSSPSMTVTSDFIEPTAMYAMALIGSGRVNEGFAEAEQMFSRIRSTSTDHLSSLAMEIEEGMEVVMKFMASKGIQYPSLTPEMQGYTQSSYTPVPFTPSLTPTTFEPALEDTYDPYAASTDFKSSSLIADELERGNGSRAKHSRLNEAMARFRNVRRAGRHPRYITYAKLITAAAKENRMTLAHDILAMARTDIPLLTQYPVVRYGWVSILDAMVGACLESGNRSLAGRYHQELLDMGAAPSANNYGLYITTLKKSAKTFDEASEAVKIFRRAREEGVEPSPFLYNALIGKLGKARRIDDCLYYFGEMRGLGIHPTSVTYGTVVNALTRVSDEKFAEDLFDEMEAQPDYKRKPAPYNCMMQFFLNTKHDKSKVLAYYERMKSKGIEATDHTYKILIDAHATLEPINMPAAEAVLDLIRSTGNRPEAIHYSALIKAKGCMMHDVDGARAVFDSVIADPSIAPEPCLYQALFESMVANRKVTETEPVLQQMASKGLQMTPYIANTLIKGWASENNLAKSEAIFASVAREPSTYEAMTRAYLAAEDRPSAQRVVQEMLTRPYPSNVSSKIVELLDGGKVEISI